MKTILISLALLTLPAWAEFKVPATPNPVNDYANVLSAESKEYAAKAIIQLKTDLNVQMGVLIVPTLDGTDIESASMKVAESWKLGTKDDAGVLLMLSMAEHKSRLEIGKGLEGILTDADSKNILASMRPLLKRGDVGGALLFGINGVQQQVMAHKGEILQKPTGETAGDFSGILLSVFIGIGLFLLAAYYLIRQTKPKKTVPIDTGIPEYMRYNKTYTAPIMPKRARGAPTSSRTHTHESDDSFTKGVVAGVIADEVFSSHSSSSDSGSSYSSSSSSDYSSSSSDWSGGGSSDSFSGGGSSDSW